MSFENKLAGIFNLTDKNWMKHANPWSVWTRYSVLPIIVMGFWARLWVGWWCLLCVVPAFVWLYINPICFKKAKSTNNWASKAVLGERVYLNRDQVSIPYHHRFLPYVLNIIVFVGLLCSIYGVIEFAVWPTCAGVVLVYVGKSWYLDRMVWLYEDMKHLPEYRQWLY